MKKIRVSGLLVAASALAIAGTAPAFALTAPYIILSDAPILPAGPQSTSAHTVYIDATGAVTYGGSSCNATTCPTNGAVVAVPGLIVWSGTIGNFTVFQGTATWAVAAPVPTMDLNLPSVSTPACSGPGSTNCTTAGGTLYAYFTVTQLIAANAPTSTTISTSFFTGTTPSSLGTAGYNFLIDNHDVAYGQSGYNGQSAISFNPSGSGAQTNIPGAAPTADPFSGTIVQTIAYPANASLMSSTDASFSGAAGSITPPPPPTITLTKGVVGSTTVSPYTKVTYSYTVKNNGSVTLTNITVTDDNATPNYKADDFTACVIPSLAGGASYTCTHASYPPVSYGANDCAPGTSFNYGNYHPGGTIICNALANGDLQFTYLDDLTNVDNTYGNDSSPDWANGNQSYQLAGNSAEFQIFDGKGNVVLDFTGNYAAANSQTISGYGPGATTVKSGNAQCLYNYHTSGTDNLNQSKAFAYQCLTNSASGSSNWVKQCGYTFTIKCSAWGSNGFGGIHCPGIYNVSTKCSGHNQHQCVPVNSTVTNCAIASTCYNGNTIYSNKSSATVTITTSEQHGSTCVPLTPKCNVSAKTPTNCKPVNGGHDGNGYSYCDALLPKTLTCNGAQFQLGSAEDHCATWGTTIPLPNEKCSSVHFLAAATNGPQYNQCFTVHYTDGSSTSITQHLSDWCSSSNFPGETVANTTAYRICPNGSRQYGTINMYHYSIPCDNTKTVASIDCPNNRNVIVHAVSTSK